MIDSTGWSTLKSKERKPSKCSQTTKESQNWGISQIHRRTLYKTVIERMLVHGSSAWCLNPTYKMKRKIFRFKGHSYSTYREHITPPQQQRYKGYSDPTPAHAITVGSHIYINLSLKNLSSL
ncbi:hypothetical protein AVEN_207000-1 [Araneus ventricosus]|uniref:Uncharacterized protein n=1 Tax=Araneus ventricosus TaxID=182803 RepID=A0A4Y2K6W4_ARAVE|nr:hypothetical protein AVEN_207000-1 [Araneus ventricosus]